MSPIVNIVICCFFVLIGATTYAQKNSISERKKLRYLRKIERKNDQYVKKQERMTKKLLTNLSNKERSFLSTSDSLRPDSSLVKNSFSKIADRLDEELAKPEETVTKLSQPFNLQKSITISENLGGDVKDYLNKQLLTTSYLTDSSCVTCQKLKNHSQKAKHRIEKTSKKLERLREVQADIQKQQETLKSYGVKTPELAGKIKEIDKSCYYYKQGMNGFKDLYTSPAKGIESSLLKKLSFSKDFKLFQKSFNALPVSLPALSGAVAPDMTGYQTKAQVQAMLPQNAAGITPEVKSQLLSNLQSSLTKFTELRDEKPDLSMLKDQPDFKINPYKGMPLQKRLVPSFTFQPQLKKLNEPITIDLGATLGFKLTERLTPMIGASTKLGLGNDIHHLAFSYQGVVAKAGVDAKLIYGFSMQGWYEATWRPLPGQLYRDQIPNYPEPSLIAGVCNTYKISKKVNGTLMIGYDFFYKKHTPVRTPWVIRMGWQ
jgi:predicted  nucleic acid-binding Zn-ribbon protein